MASLRLSSKSKQREVAPSTEEFNSAKLGFVSIRTKNNISEFPVKVAVLRQGSGRAATGLWTHRPGAGCLGDGAGYPQAWGRLTSWASCKEARQPKALPLLWRKTTETSLSLWKVSTSPRHLFPKSMVSPESLRTARLHSTTAAASQLFLTGIGLTRKSRPHHPPSKSHFIALGLHLREEQLSPGEPAGFCTRALLQS